VFGVAPKRLGKYVIEAVLGEGGMGRVYRAVDTEIGRTVALKVLLERGDHKDIAAERLKREARAASALDHANVVSVYEVGDVDGTPFIAMEYVPGRSLAHAIRDRSIPLASRLTWLLDVARALEAAHDRGLVHRDIKPSNVIVRDDGAVKVVDFGVARSVEPRAGVRASRRPFDPTQVDLPTLTEPGAMIGTIPYMAPEQVRGEPADARSDIFAWGVLAYELLMGKLPWRRVDTPSDIAAAVLLQQVDRFACPVADIVLCALEKDPGDRFPTMRELIAALEPRMTNAPTITRSEPKLTDSYVGPVTHNAATTERRPGMKGRALFAWVGSAGAATMTVVVLVVALANRGPATAPVNGGRADAAVLPDNPQASDQDPIAQDGVVPASSVTPSAPPTQTIQTQTPGVTPPRARPARPDRRSSSPAVRPSSTSDPNGWLNQR
jgi:serine/threonine protein kinase